MAQDNQYLNLANMLITYDLQEHEDIQRPMVGVQITMTENTAAFPPHSHPSGQLIMTLEGAVSCEVHDALWMVPPNCVVWIPGMVRHRCLATLNARMCFLLIKPEFTKDLPDICATLEITPLLRELVVRMCDEGAPVGDQAPMRQLLLSELSMMPRTSFNLPLPDHPKLRQIVDTVMADPSDRTTLPEWSSRLAISERTLSRLIVKETGMSFGRWRQQMHALIALRLLAAGASVQNTAQCLGYNSVNAFITMFKKSLGASPSRYFKMRNGAF